MDDFFLMLQLLAAATVRVATPLVLVALGGMYAERSGVVDIGLEGKLLASAFAAAATATVTGSAWLALLAGMLAAMALAAVHAYACVTHNGNQVVSGMAINIIASGLTPTLGVAWFRQGGHTPPVSGAGRFAPIDLPFAETLTKVPMFGSFFAKVINGHNILVYLTAAIVPLAAWLLFRTRFGLRVRAVGENPHAVDTAGISVALLRYRALLIAGALCGIGGAYLSIAQNAAFVREMSAGKGYLALAALIFGKWRPWPTLLACLLFAFADSLQVRLQGVVVPGIGEIPVQFIQAAPYVLTVLLLAGFVGKAVAPKAIGIPYTKEGR